jgi:WD40 repeat protein
VSYKTLFPSISTFETQPARYVRNTAFSSDGTFVVTTTPDDTAYVWDPRSGDPIAPLREPSDRHPIRRRLLTSVAVSPNDELIATWRGDLEVTSRDAWSDIGDNVAHVWEAKSGKWITKLEGHDQSRPIVYVTFSPDSRLVATASLDRTARIFDARRGAVIAKLTGHDNAVASIAFSPNGNLVATASGDGTIRVWEAVTGKPIDTIRGTAPFLGVTFVGDGTTLATIDDSGHVRLFRCELCAPFEQLLTLARSRTRATAASHAGTKDLFARNTGQ